MALGRDLSFFQSARSAAGDLSALLQQGERNIGDRVIRGQLYAHQPWWTLLDDIWSRNLREMDFSKRVAAVLAVTGTAACNAQQLPWSLLT